MIRSVLFAAALVISASAGAADKYTFDPTHTQVRFEWNHFGFSNPSALFTDIKGELLLDTKDLTKSSVNVTLPLSSLASGVPKLDEHLRGADFFDAAKFADVTFKSTSVAKAGENKLKITGDLTVHGVTKPVVLDVNVNKIGQHPMAKDDAAGFDATTTIKRSDFGVGAYVPNVSDEIKISITTETHKAK